MRTPLARLLPLVLAAAAALVGCAAEDEPAEAPPSALPRRLAATPVPAPPRPGFPRTQERILPGISFVKAAALVAPPDESGRLYVLEQAGRIMQVPTSAQDLAAPIFHDMRHRVGRLNAEDGLLGLAFHPDFARNRTLFISFVAQRPTRLVVSRFTTRGSEPDRVDPESETVFLEAKLPFDDHRGGGLAFGPDGLLYVGIGDGGGFRDPLRHARNLESLLGKVLRLDVSARSIHDEYAIPVDNPWIANGEEYRQEIFAYGFCGPRRLSVDPATGTVWVAESTGGLGERILRLARGQDHGWGAPEPARSPGLAIAPAGPPAVAPVATYAPDQGARLVSAFVYRGRAWPALQGQLLYADRESGHVWRRPAAPGGGATRLLTFPKGIADLAADGSGELLLLSREGHLHRLR